MIDKEQTDATYQEIMSANKSHSRDLDYPIAISQMAEDMGYNSEEAVTTEIGVGELFNRRYFARKRQAWVVQAMKNVAPKEFYVWLRIPHMSIDINTFAYGVARGQWNNVGKAIAFCKAKLKEANPEWAKLYTFQYSFVPAKGGTMVMIPSIRRKMDEKSRFMKEGGRIQLARRVEKGETDYTMTHQEVEQEIESGSFDNVDPFIEDTIGEFQKKYQECQTNAKTWKHVAESTNEAQAWQEFKQANAEYKGAYNKLKVVRSRRNAYNSFSTDRCADDLDLRECSNAYAMKPRDRRLLTETELAYLNLFKDRQDLQDCLLNKDDPQMQLTDGVEEMIFETDISDEELCLISVDILGEPVLPTLEDMREGKELKEGEETGFTRQQYEEHDELLEEIRVDAAIANILVELAPETEELHEKDWTV
jgi:flagellar biosynthesis chaperone FliJ